MNNKRDRTGEAGINKHGMQMVIVNYENKNEILIEFQDDYKYCCSTNYQAFKKHQVRNPYDRTVFNIGYLGNGQYRAYEHRTKQTKEYQTWFGMMRRCYSNELKKVRPTYSNCYACKDWYNFQNFAEWYHQNYYEINNEKICLDKDALFKGNKLYSPDTCVLVPERINTFYTKRDNDRGKYLIGVSKDHNKYKAYCNNPFGKRVVMEFDTEIEAFMFYKKTKERFAEKLANYYKGSIPTRLYQALINYCVGIND